jgi:ribosomal protein S18 acetylase RimI-like enzyme
MDAAHYSAIETLRDGRRVEIRAIRPADRDGLLAAFGRTSTQSRFRRFFAVRGEFSEREIAFFVDVDFVGHVALVAVAESPAGTEIVGGGRYVGTEPGVAEVAFAIIDAYQGQGLGSALMRHLGALARAAGLRELVAEVLPENGPMLKVFERSGFPVHRRRDGDVVHVTLQLT